jgi:hypothetical protein
MNIITIEPNGWLTQNEEKISSEPLVFLNHAVVLGPDIIFRDYFKMLSHYDVFTKINAFCSGCMRRYDECPESDCTSGAFEALEFGKSIEMIGFPGEPRLEIFTSLKAIGTGETKSISKYPMEYMLDMPVRLGSLKHVVFGDTVDMFEFETVFTLFEFIDGIAWELSFQNMPITCELRR